MAQGAGAATCQDTGRLPQGAVTRHRGAAIWHQQGASPADRKIRRLGVNYYRRYCGDYIRDTQDLTLVEHGVYTTLLDLYYSIGHPIPSPIETLCRICRANSDEERAAVEAIANRFFPLNGDGLRHNKRADIELGNASKAIAKMSEAGRAGARKRWDRAPNRVAMQPPTTILQPPKERSKTTTRPTKQPFELPDWIPRPQWDAWLEARTKARKAPTEYAKRLAVAKLAELHEQGHNPAQVLAQSAFNGYTGLFPIKEPKR